VLLHACDQWQKKIIWYLENHFLKKKKKKGR
jgi:hypothetical protein